MRKKLASTVALAALILLAVTGCWDSVDINRQNIVVTVVLDRDDEGYVLYAEIANTDSAKQPDSGGAGPKPYVVVRAEGKTIVEARADMERQMDEPIYLGAVRALVLTENVSREDVGEYLHRLMVDKAYRKKVFTVVTADRPEDLFKMSEGGESVGFYIEDMLDQLVRAGGSFYRPTARFIENATSRYRCFVIPAVRVSGGNLEFSGYSVIMDDRSVGTIPAGEATGLVLFMAPNAAAVYTVSYGGVPYTVHVERKGLKVRSHWDGERISFDADFRFRAEIQYFDEKAAGQLTDETKEKLHGELTCILTHELEKTVALSQKYYGCDYLDFSDEFHIAYPDVYHVIEWGDVYPDIPIRVSADVRLEIQQMIDFSPHVVE